jgi:hypothetical protein
MTKLAQLALNEEGFAFDPTTGDSYLINRTGLQILRALRDHREDGEVARMLAEAYGLTAGDAERDVADFRERLKGFGLA